jgi:hypothetical protein
MAEAYPSDLEQLREEMKMVELPGDIELPAAGQTRLCAALNLQVLERHEKEILNLQTQIDQLRARLQTEFDYINFDPTQPARSSPSQ